MPPSKKVLKVNVHGTTFHYDYIDKEVINLLSDVHHVKSISFYVHINGKGQKIFDILSTRD